MEKSRSAATGHLSHHQIRQASCTQKTRREKRDSEVERREMKPATVQRYLQAISGMLKMCLEDGLVDRNVAAGLTSVHDPEPANRKRLAWDIKRLNKWFSWTIYGAPVEKWSHFQWLPLLGLYTGARLEELCRLRIEDVKRAKGILVLDIRWREGEPLKTKAAERVVPVHSALIELGFDKYVARVRHMSEHLWPTLSRSRATDKWSSNYSKWFTRARRRAGVYERKLDFHSFRGNFTTGLLNAGVPLERVQALVGHKAQGVTMGVYAKGVDVKLLKGDIEKLGYEGLGLPGGSSGA